MSRAGYREAVRSEWTKLRSVRSSVITLAILGIVFPAFSVLVAGTESLQPDDTILGASVLGGAVLAQMCAAVLGTQLMTSELRTGTIRVTLAACPRRLVVVSAKATVAAVSTGAVTLVSSAVAHRVGLGMLDRDDYATGEPWPALVGVALAVAAISVLGVGIGTVVRHPAGAVVAIVGVVLLPGMFAPLLGEAERWVGGASLDGVMQKLSQSSDATHETVGSLGGWPSLAVVAAYTVAFGLGATWVLRHRDT